MTKRIKILSLVLLLFAILGITACGGNKDARKFVGSWKCFDSQGNTTVITFNADGSWTRHIESVLDPKGNDYTGKYVINEDEKTVTINIDPLPGDRLRYTTEVFYHYILTEDTLTLHGTSDSAKTEQVFQRIKT